MKKQIYRLLSLVLCALLLLGAAPAAGLAGLADWLSVTASAETFTGACGANVGWSLDTSTGVLTVTGSGAMNNLGNWNLQPWASYRSQITSIVIEDGVTAIGTYVFYGCENLSRVTIGSGVTIIGQYAFSSCSMLPGITIPDTVQSIDQYAFNNCSILARVTIGSGVASIGNSAFYACANLANLTIGGNVRSIGASAFSNCTSLAEVTIPDSVMSIGNDAFYYCTQLAKVTLGSGVISIGQRAFMSCYKLQGIHIPSGVEGIGNNAFSSCGNTFYICCNVENSYAKTFAQTSAIPFVLCNHETAACAHTYAEAVTTAPTCTAAGVKTFTCTKCGSSYTQSVAALGHSFTKYVYNNDATREKDGTKTAKCDRCDAKDTVPAPGTKLVPRVSIRNYAESRTVDYRATVTFTADVENAVDGAQVVWLVDAEEKGTGETYTVENAQKTYTVQAKYMKDGTVVAESPVETVNVKTGFFARVIAFFRALFGLLPRRVQSVPETDAAVRLLAR